MATACNPIRRAPGKVLYRAFDRLRRTRGGQTTWTYAPNPEERLLALLAMESELHRRGIRGLGFVL